METSVDCTQNRKNKAFKLISKTVIYTFAAFGMVFILMLLGIMSLLNPSAKLVSVPDKTILTIDFNQNYSEIRQDDLLADLLDQSTYSVFDLSRAIYLAAEDERVEAVWAEINTTPLGLAQIQNLAEAIRYFRSKGKKAYAFSSGMGSFGGGNKEYYLAAAFDEIWLQPNSDIGLTGVGIEVPFFSNLLKKVGITPEFYTRYEYKTAVSSLLDSNFTPAYKAELEKLGGGLYDQLVSGVSAFRNIPENEVKKLINTAPLFADQALESGLADKIAYRQELAKMLKKTYNADFLAIDDYMAHIGETTGSNVPEVAFMVLDGVIEDKSGAENPLSEAVISSKNVLQQLDELRENENLKALVIRLNSPGGSYLASDEIWHALNEFKTSKNIPVVISMSNYAASGGYFIALAGDYIFAEEATVTGSIGVLGGKFVLKDLWQKLDINWGEISFGSNAGILSANHKFTPAQKKIFDQSLDRIYADFTQKVSQARGIDMKDMDMIARGRIWLGRDALRLNLIDELGGIESALGKAKELARIEQNENFNLLFYPRGQNLQEKLTKFLEKGGGLSAVQGLDNFGIDAETFRSLFHLRFDTVLPPFKIEM